MITARPPRPGSTDPHFQGMFSLPNQPVELTIVNLRSEGPINFNVLHTPHRVSEVDPGPAYGINAVNELRPGECYTIPCDQRTNKAMILAGETKRDKATGAERAVSVKEAEAAGGGLHFFLSVVSLPRSCAFAPTR